MELTHLRYVTAVADELHFGRAARRLNVSQPPLSQMIKRLEDELGVSLFSRTSRSVELTEAGKIFCAEAREILRRADSAAGLMRGLAGGVSGVLRIGFNEPSLSAFLPAAIKVFRKKYPSVKLSLYETETQAQLTALKNGALDIGFLRFFGQDVSEFEVLEILREPYMLALPKGHPLENCDNITVSALRGYPMIFFPKEIQPALHDTVMLRFLESGAAPAVAQEAITKQTTLAFVEAGLGWALIPASVRRKNARSGVVFRELGIGLPDVVTSAVRLKNSGSAAAVNFLTAVRQTARPAAA